MEIVSFVSLKGGAGKTTSLQVLASALLTKGHRVALVESDENTPLTQWRENARARGTWDEGCEIHPGGTVDLVLGSVVAVEKAGAEFLLVDTHGGGSELNNAVVINSSIVVVPTAITSADVPRCVDTLTFLSNLRESEELDGDQVIAILVTRFQSRRSAPRNSAPKLGATTKGPPHVQLASTRRHRRARAAGWSRRRDSFPRMMIRGRPRESWRKSSGSASPERCSASRAWPPE